ncbi:MAG: hypothetical protein FJ100_08450 [Deltaproteobacteria bacterium]|nr:hypothetical protein [Deltaproteobacteria bacterium]
MRPPHALIAAVAWFAAAPGIAQPSADLPPGAAKDPIALPGRADDPRSAVPRPDLVFIEPLGDIDAPGLYSAGAVDFRAMIEAAAPVALKRVFAKTVTAFSPPMSLRIVARKIQLRVSLGRMQVSVDAVLFDAANRAKVFRERGEGERDLPETATGLELRGAVEDVLAQAAEELSVRLLGRMSAPPPPKPKHKWWAGAIVGGTMLGGLSGLAILAPRWSAQVTVNPLWPRIAAALSGGRRLHQADDLSFWAHVGVTREFATAALSRCAPYLCPDQARSLWYGHVRLELAQLVGDANQHRLAAEVGVHMGAEEAKFQAPWTTMTRPWAGASYHWGF